jgi:hypothetical protein
LVSAFAEGFDAKSEHPVHKSAHASAEPTPIAQIVFDTSIS